MGKEEILEKMKNGSLELQDTAFCGFPHHLLLPRGTKEGMIFDLVAMITDPSDFTQPGRNSSNASSFVHCGLIGEEYPDRKPMGYPWDRKPDEGNEFLEDLVGKVPNMVATQIT